jgi:hypothetical protein
MRLVKINHIMILPTIEVDLRMSVIIAIVRVMQNYFITLTNIHLSSKFEINST